MVRAGWTSISRRLMTRPENKTEAWETPFLSSGKGGSQALAAPAPARTRDTIKMGRAVSYVSRVNRKYSAVVPNRMFGAQAASKGGRRALSPSAPKMPIMAQYTIAITTLVATP